MKQAAVEGNAAACFSAPFDKDGIFSGSLLSTQTQISRGFLRRPLFSRAEKRGKDAPKGGAPWITPGLDQAPVCRSHPGEIPAPALRALTKGTGRIGPADAPQAIVDGWQSDRSKVSYLFSASVTHIRAAAGTEREAVPITENNGARQMPQSRCFVIFPKRFSRYATRRARRRAA